jgi:uncharacterized protein
MGKKTFWIVAGILFIFSIYNTYDNYLLHQDIKDLSAALDRLNISYVTNTTQPTIPLESFSIEKNIPIVAVSSNGEGVTGNLTVKLIPGNNNVLINTNPFLETDIQYSANTAVAVAKLSSNYNYDKDFIFDFKAGEAQLIGGESAGAAIAIATIAALQNKNLKNEAVITGTINPDGTIGKIGWVIEKAKAVADAGYKYFLVPKGQSKVTYYEKQLVREPFGFGFEILNTRYVPKTIDLKKVAKDEWNLEVIEVSTIGEALPYFMGE